LSFTRLLEDWQRLNPTLADMYIALIFRVCCIHASFHKKLRAASNTADPQHNLRTLEVLSQIERDMNVCLAILEQYADASPVALTVYNVALKTVMDQRITELEKAEVTMGVDIPIRKSGAGGLVEIEKDEQIDAQAKQLRSLRAVYEQNAVV
jgi:hypothetical protein